eukprot:NODE_1003_length_1051_cov_17.377246_g829_i0.p5 GENE.NODE_1003_length_1051_cov_17.377246_g829_i0~~NODE_1003_length_1051_cov_17.377246_g829_i0.p5  ORF type:complete len:57 (-),score=0.34 NODE_1003_length_1051_cov_17.377246_g829_i0:403-573(-)
MESQPSLGSVDSLWERAHACPLPAARALPVSLPRVFHPHQRELLLGSLGDQTQQTM